MRNAEWKESKQFSVESIFRFHEYLWFYWSNEFFKGGRNVITVEQFSWNRWWEETYLSMLPGILLNPNWCNYNWSWAPLKYIGVHGIEPQLSSRHFANFAQNQILKSKVKINLFIPQYDGKALFLRYPPQNQFTLVKVPFSGKWSVSQPKI